MSTELLDQEFIKKIGRLDIVSRKIFSGKIKGERRSKRKGSSVEFADFRNYAQGDDLRFIDWNIFGRLDRLFIKLFLEEEDLFVYLLVDASRSMAYGEPEKLFYAKKVAAALAYIGLSNFNRIIITTFAGDVTGELPALRGKRQMAKVLDFLTNLPAGGETDFPKAARNFSLRHTRKGVVVVISDFMDRHGYEDAFRYLLGRKFDLFAIQVLSPGEIEPELAGEIRLTDSEDRGTVDISVSRALLKMYRQNLAALTDGIKQYLARRGANYFFASTSFPFDELVLNYLRDRGLLK